VCAELPRVRTIGFPTTQPNGGIKDRMIPNWETQRKITSPCRYLDAIGVRARQVEPLTRLCSSTKENIII